MVKVELIKPGWCPECGDTKYNIKKGSFTFCSHCGVCIGTDASKPLTDKERNILLSHKSCEPGWNTKFYLDDIGELE